MQEKGIPIKPIVRFARKNILKIKENNNLLKEVEKERRESFPYLDEYTKHVILLH